MQGRKVDGWKQDIKTAIELLYSNDVIEALKHGKDANKRTKNLRDARLNSKN